MSQKRSPRLRVRAWWRSPRVFFGRLFVLLDGEEWLKTLRDFQAEAWRLETLPQYLVPQETDEIEAFRAGKRIDPETYASPYVEDLKRLRGERKCKGRVHIVRRDPECASPHFAGFPGCGCLSGSSPDGGDSVVTWQPERGRNPWDYWAVWPSLKVPVQCVSGSLPCAK
ncbi:DUF6879 family protein [Streptomyces sp. NPDC052109]|uniref:DUF6879 family protein n=1 Tax=Streptomyces sp. NPDC052109 TaxID=3155527 RepID=UPI003433A862